MKAWELDVVEELKVEGKNNLFAIFLISATMQDSGKRKRSDVTSTIAGPIFYSLIAFS